MAIVWLRNNCYKPRDTIMYSINCTLYVHLTFLLLPQKTEAHCFYGYCCSKLSVVSLSPLLPHMSSSARERSAKHYTNVVSAVDSREIETVVLYDTNIFQEIHRKWRHVGDRKCWEMFGDRYMVGSYYVKCERTFNKNWQSMINRLWLICCPCV